MTIDEAIARIPGWANAASVTAAPLAGGLTNANYRVDVDGESFVVRLWTPGVERLGINREREYQCTLVAGQVGAGPEVTHVSFEAGLMVMRFIAGQRPSAEALTHPAVLERLVRTMQRYHSGPPFPGHFSPFATLEAYLDEVLQAGVPLPDDIDAIYDSLREIDRAVRAGSPLIRPCHNDLWGPNLIDDDARLYVVDWEYAGNGDAYFDLANFAVHHTSTDKEDEALLRAYFGLVQPAGFARLRLLKAVAELREALWYLVAQTTLSGTEGFEQRAEAHFERYRQALGDERMPAWFELVARGA